MKTKKFICPTCKEEILSVYVELGGLVIDEDTQEIKLLQTSMESDDEYFSLDEAGITLTQIGECNECGEKHPIKDFIVQ